MKRTQLFETNIEDLRNFNWIEYFENNNSNLINFDNATKELSEEEIALIAPSIKAFQIGERSDGKHLIKVAERFAEKYKYEEYLAIAEWLVAEENRHSRTLKNYMEIHDIEPSSIILIDSIFRLLRKIMGLEGEIIVLVTAEIIALLYYRALSNVSDDAELLKIICNQILNDELKHVVLQSDTLYRISKDRKESTNKMVRNIRKILMNATSFVVWNKYKKLFIKGNYTYEEFKNYCMEYLEESVYIEKNGKIM